MKIWEYMVNSAMLGSDKPAPGRPDLPGELSVILDQINNSARLDRESKFLQQAAIVCNYRKSGFQPLQKSDVLVSIAAPEDLSYADGPATSALNAVLGAGNVWLLELWMQRCCDADKLVPPDLLPQVLDQAKQHRSLRKLVTDCVGNRGKWLSQFNPDWDYFGSGPSEEETWLIGTQEERTNLLKAIRLINPEQAREMVVQSWLQENAGQKLEFLKVLRPNKQASDLPWLESLSSEKGKVRDEIQSLLRQIPGSAIIQKYETFLSDAFYVKKEKALFGMISKNILQFNFPEALDDGIYKSGIDKLAPSNSEFSDEQYVTAQIITCVPPVYWEKQLEASPEQVVEYFVKQAGKFVGSLAIAVARFQEAKWVPYFLELPTLYPDFLMLISAAEQEKYLLNFKDSLPRDVMHYALMMDQEWSIMFAGKIIQMMSADPYSFNLGSFRKNISLIPVGMLHELEKLGPDRLDLAPAWENVKKGLEALLLLKQQVLEAFNIN